MSTRKRSFYAETVEKIVFEVYQWRFIFSCTAKLNTCTCAWVFPSVRLWSKLNFFLFDPLSLLSCAHDSLKCWWQLAHDSLLMTADDSFQITADDSLLMTADDSWPETNDLPMISYPWKLTHESLPMTAYPWHLMTGYLGQLMTPC